MYPEEFSRVNSFARMYCEIAVENYYNAKEFLEFIKNSQDYEKVIRFIDLFNKSVIKTIVFSNMTIESLINDYLSACLGDDCFYKKYDMLRLMEKINLSCDFILNKQIDRSGELFYLLGELIKNRNNFVHLKSRDGSQIFGIREEKILNEIEKIEPLLQIDITEEEKDFKIATNSIKAIVCFCEFFDKYDKNVNMTRRIFSIFKLEGINFEKDYMIKVVKEFKIFKGKDNEI